jgi:hypothetical protein
MSPDDSIDAVLLLSQRKLVVAREDVFLNRGSNNDIFILLVEESRGSAGGRAAGSGHRRISRILGFSCENGRCDKFFDTSDPQVIDMFDIPYSAVAMDIRLSSGTPYVVQGVVDPSLVAGYRALTSNLK